MPKGTGHRAALRPKKRVAAIGVTGPTLSKGRELWQIWADGQRQTIVTSAASGAAMDRATAAFAPALKRLADR